MSGYEIPVLLHMRRDGVQVAEPITESPAVMLGALRSCARQLGIPYAYATLPADLVAAEWGPIALVSLDGASVEVEVKLDYDRAAIRSRQDDAEDRIDIHRQAVRMESYR